MTVNTANQRTSVTWRSVILALFLIPLNAIWIMQMEAVYYSAHSTLIALFFNVVCNLLILILLNVPLRRLSPKLAFSQGELLTIYVMLSLSSALVGHSMIQILPATMAAPLALATPENDWHDLFWRYVPKWLAISDERALEGYVRGVKKGEPTLYLTRNIEAWLPPVIAWSLFIIALMFVMICINIIIRKQWTDREKLTYPIAQLPFEMTNQGAKLFNRKLFWLSFSIVGLIGIINGLSFYFPNVPYLRNSPPLRPGGLLYDQTVERAGQNRAPDSALHFGSGFSYSP